MVDGLYNVERSFQQYFSYSKAASVPIHAFLEFFFLTITPHNILYKPLAALPQIHHRNNREMWERNESYHNGNH